MLQIFHYQKFFLTLFLSRCYQSNLEASTHALHSIVTGERKKWTNGVNGINVNILYVVLVGDRDQQIVLSIIQKIIIISVAIEKYFENDEISIYGMWHSIFCWFFLFHFLCWCWHWSLPKTKPKICRSDVDGKKRHVFDKNNDYKNNNARECDVPSTNITKIPWQQMLSCLARLGGEWMVGH